MNFITLFASYPIFNLITLHFQHSFARLVIDSTQSYNEGHNLVEMVENIRDQAFAIVFCRALDKTIPSPYSTEFEEAGPSQPFDFEDVQQQLSPQHSPPPPTESQYYTRTPSTETDYHLLIHHFLP